MSTNNVNTKFSKKLSDFKTILGLTPNEALAVSRNDGWFEINKNNDAVVRSVNYEVNTNNEITKILKKNDSTDSTYMVVDKTLNSDENLYKTPEDITGKLLASVLFSVLGNKGPFEKFKQFYEQNGVADTNEKKMFLAHLAWFHGNGGITGYGVNDDPLIQREMLLLGINKDNVQNFKLPNPASGNEIFNDNVYFKNFKIIFDENKRMFDNFKMDLDRSTKFLETLQEQQEQEEQKRKSYMNQLPQLGGKKNKKSRKLRKSQKSRKSRKSRKKQ